MWRSNYKIWDIGKSHSDQNALQLVNQHNHYESELYRFPNNFKCQHGRVEVYLQQRYSTTDFEDETTKTENTGNFWISIER